MAIRASARFDGAENDEVQNLPSAGDVHRSTDYQPSNTVEVQRGFFKQTVSSADELQDSDMVTVDGIEINAKMAREMGLMGEVFRPVRKPEDLDPGLGKDSATQRPQGDQLDEQQDEGTGNEAYDTAAKGLNEALEAGTMEYEEAQVYDTAMAQAAMAGIDVDDAVQTLDDLANGTKTQLDVGSETATMLRNAEAQVTQAATKSAMAELGQEGFQWLQNASNTHPGVGRAVRQYAVDRSRGQAGGITWNDFAQHIRSEMGHA